jgi:hypothetical protein
MEVIQYQYIDSLNRREACSAQRPGRLATIAVGDRRVEMTVSSVNGYAGCLVTFNLGHFGGATRAFGIHAIRLGELLRKIRLLCWKNRAAWLRAKELL